LNGISLYFPLLARLLGTERCCPVGRSAGWRRRAVRTGPGPRPWPTRSFAMTNASLADTGLARRRPGW